MAKRTTKQRGVLDGYETYDTSKGFGNDKSWRTAFQERMSKEEAQSILAEDKPETILGIPEGSTQMVIKKAFRLLIMQWHPDRNPDKVKEAEEMTRRIIAAYTSLTS